MLPGFPIKGLKKITATDHKADAGTNKNQNNQK